MTTTKIITNAIYFAGLIPAIIFDINNFQVYYGIVFIAIQIIFIAAEYIVTNRIIPNETILVKKDSPVTLKDLLLAIAFIVVVFVGFNFLFKLFTIKYLVTYIAIYVFSATIQYLLAKGKLTAALLINKNNLIINDLFLKTYNLETLKSITFNGSNEIYTVEFENLKKIKIKQDDYRNEELNKFIAVMTTKSNCNVLLSENIKNGITAAIIGKDNS
ncbi:MAG: hypothetical protein ABI091_09960 [Ferruginibacter sp.]